MKVDGEKIRTLREERNMTQSDLAKTADVSISYLSEIENGRKKPSLKVLSKLAQALKVAEYNFFSAETFHIVSMGEKIKLLRLENKLTLTKLAEETGYSVSYLSDIERGASKASMEAINKIAKVLKLHPSTFLENDISFGNKLKKVRTEQGVTQSLLADQAGVSPGLIAQLEKGRVQPSLGTIEKIAQALSISPCYFILSDVGPEDMMRQIGPDLRELLLQEEVQSILKLICHCNTKELQFIMRFIKLFKESRHYMNEEEIE